MANLVKLDAWFMRYASEHCQTDRETNRHTDTLIEILCPPIGGEAK